MQENQEQNAKSYQKHKLWLTLVNYILSFSLILVVIFSGLTVVFRDAAVTASSLFAVQILVYFILFSLYFYIFDFPLSVYSGYVLERKFSLSNQNFSSWFKESIKKSLLSFVLGIFLVEIFYFLVRSFPGHWWWMTWAVWLLFTLVFGRLAPVLIFPLFYKFKPLENGDLKDRIVNLVEANGLKLENVYVFNMSKTTKKANAAFCGMGKTQRVILADTLLENFTTEEIEMVVAHEMGHCKLRHIWKRVIWGAFISLIAFFLAYTISSGLAVRMGYNGVGDVASLPLVMLVFVTFGLLMMPVENSYSRKHEYEADAFAYDKSQFKSAFSTLMEKLGKLNMADPNPHPLIEFVLYDHPSIQHRIKRIQSRSA